MSRTKKSRKPGSAPTAKPKLSKQELANVEKRVRKKTGKQSGNRQKEATAALNTATSGQAQKDPRLGSKKPIALGKMTAKAEKQTLKAQSQTLAPIAAVRVVASSDLSPEQALMAIEQDETLLQIIAKQEEDLPLTEQEVNYYNDMMERHEALSEEIGDVEEEHAVQDSSANSEDDLWNKLDSHDFSDFEDE